MPYEVKRIFVEKKQDFAVEAKGMYADLTQNLGITGLKHVRLVNRYDISGISQEEFAEAKRSIFSEPTVDDVYDEILAVDPENKIFAVEYLPGQYDQRAHWAAQCVQILTKTETLSIRTAKVIVLQGNITEDEFKKIKEYSINPVEAREASLEKPRSLELTVEKPADVKTIPGFITQSAEELELLLKDMGLAMGLGDIAFCQQYFRDVEKRNPTITEIRVLDTYWSDHCRHTTFFTTIENVNIGTGHFSVPIAKAYDQYRKARSLVYQDRQKDICLMDIAVMGMKELRLQGKLTDLDDSEEINACSIVVPVDVDGSTEEWLVMFKNETHNHPTEIEPFGGAATCLGGAIRDPLSGRSYVYQAMRVTGSGDPRTKVEDTLAGKLPQRKITLGAAAGYSSYGNQIGLATGQVAEIYHEGFIAKRMEIGAVIAAAPKENVVRERPVADDIVVVLGGKTGRDGCGGATGSSKEHTEESLATCSAEVQKGNPPTERKIQRLFRNPKASQMIKRCNDFGAGGASVAIGELTDSLVIDLDAMPKKYAGLDGTELAISESQERMAVVIAPHHLEEFMSYVAAENLEAAVVAKVTDTGRLVMLWRGIPIVDISREFLNTNGVKQKVDVQVTAPIEAENYFAAKASEIDNLEVAWLDNLRDLNVCSQKGLVEMFDSTIGASTVLMPFGGKFQTTPAEGMASKIPVLKGNTNTATLMTYGYDPQLSTWSPFHGAVYAVVEAVAKIVAMGGEYHTVRLTLQEYFERLGQDAVKWGKPFSALLGALHAQEQFSIPAIGGKDSMSGTFKELTVPPTLVAFAVNVVQADQVISPEFKKIGSQVIRIPLVRDAYELPDFPVVCQNYANITQLIKAGYVLAAHTIKTGGLAAAISKMSFGNKIGMTFTSPISSQDLFAADYGSLILEIPSDISVKDVLGEMNYSVLGHTKEQVNIDINGYSIDLEKAQAAWEKPLTKVFATQTETSKEKPKQELFSSNPKKAKYSFAKPRIFIPVFPGTNCEYDSAKAFEMAGGIVDTMVIRNLTPAAIEESIEEMVKSIDQSQIIMLPGGFSAGDEPDGSGKYIATMFRNPKIKEALREFLSQKDGLMLGICNGFQALIKLGLVPYGDIVDLSPECPTLTYNQIGRHISCMANTKLVSKLSPWFNNIELGEVHTIPVSHGEGRFVASSAVLNSLRLKGQIATQYVDEAGQPTYDIRYNPNGSVEAVEGITSPDGRILGKMGHSERIGNQVVKNVPGSKDQQLFAAGIGYFK
ncbi:phosphoribosylformylglycinamidine synthase [Pelosinus propionicus]|uniref:Phosphoribosylformylglycinamidine synthase n=1 Tax=Pelosinus propionicus DSM 13327 TaxID=1123291 RepID=A0A1I4KER5_9FIRM|nr:phosphoribosylformylglycinamidine synthase [Pelosinus propionicus]SFL77230.1 phosphoribosylformylglycinamidine synthase [Pelosinus propionicus DSM 13327]